MPIYESVFHKTSAVTEYEALRHIPSEVLVAVAESVLDRIPRTNVDAAVRILDAGAGSGRFLLPLARRCAEVGIGFDLLGLDSSQMMLDDLQRRYRAADLGMSVTVRTVCADLQEPLQVEPASAHVAFTAATFHILRRWREAADNIVETLIPGGGFVVIQENNQFMHQTEGFARDGDFPYLDETLSEFMRYYHWVRSELGTPYEPSEVRYSDMSPLLDYVQEIGLAKRPCTVDRSALRWQKPHSFDDIMSCFRQRNMTTWGSELSEGIRQCIADRLDRWLDGRGIDTQEEFLLPAALIPHVFVK